MNFASRMRYVAISLGCAITALDLMTKWIVRSNDWLYSYTIIEGFFKIHYVRNEGIAFGLFHGVESQLKPIIINSFAIVALVFVLYYIWSTPLHERIMLLCLGLLLGGVLGNCIERMMRGHVTDFIELHWKDLYSWPTFNVADSAITCGVMVLLFQTFFWQHTDVLKGTKNAAENR